MCQQHNNVTRSGVANGMGVVTGLYYTLPPTEISLTIFFIVDSGRNIDNITKNELMTGIFCYNIVFRTFFVSLENFLGILNYSLKLDK